MKKPLQSYKAQSPLQRRDILYISKMFLNSLKCLDCSPEFSSRNKHITVSRHNTVSANLMLIMSTYRVVLHISYFWRVFSFVKFIKDRYSCTTSHRKDSSSWGCAVGRAKVTSMQSFCIAIVCKQWHRCKTGTLYTCMLFYLFIKHLSLKCQEKTNTLAQLCCCARETNCIHRSLNAGFFWKLNKVIFPLQPKTHFFGDLISWSKKMTNPSRASQVQCCRRLP